MITAVALCHPSSSDLINSDVFKSGLVRYIRVACGTTKVASADYSESADFFPSYASWNTSLFETSVILTIWEHADELIKDDHVAILHTDITHNHSPSLIWRKVYAWLNSKPDRSIGLTIPSNLQFTFDGLTIPEDYKLTPSNDPMYVFPFDNNVHVWEYIRKYDFDAYQWAMDTNPQLIYSHQFACSRQVFDYLGGKLYNVASRLRLSDCGFWTPHVFERLIAIYLAQKAPPLLTTAFLHHASSGPSGPGSQTLYGPRAIKFYKLCTRANKSWRV